MNLNSLSKIWLAIGLASASIIGIGGYNTEELAPLAKANSSLAQAPTLPFKLEIAEVAGSQLPALHSYSSAMVSGKWLILGGRVVGLHGFGSAPTNFPRSSANTMAYVIDPAANKVLGSVDLVKALKPEIAGPLTATNQESVQVGTSLYIVGGYGQNLKTGKNMTLGSIVKIDVPGIIGAIVAKTPIASYISQGPTSDNRLKVSGGALTYSNGLFYLVFGQDFAGDYSIRNGDYNRAGGQFQKYTEKVRVFSLSPNLSINAYNQIDAGYDANLPYHRRDLNVVDIIQPDGRTPGAFVFGGVFLAGQIGGHTRPIGINYSGSVTGVTAKLYSNFKQALNHYDCAQVTIFDGGSSSSFTTLFGGVSQFHYDSKTGTLIRDQINLPVDGLPFINTISTIKRNNVGAFSQYIQPAAMPGLLGTDSRFLVSAGLSGTQVFPNGVINLAGLQGRTLVGYVYGGIESSAPYSGLSKVNPPTWSSRRLFQVYVTPGASPVIPMPPLPTTATPYPPKP